jgi:hypothetical protein
MKTTLTQKTAIAAWTLALLALPAGAQTGAPLPKGNGVNTLPATSGAQGNLVMVEESSPLGNCYPKTSSCHSPRGKGNCRYCLLDRFFGYCEEFDAPPLGHWLNMHMNTQIANGIAARMMLYNYDFVCGKDMLNLRGSDRLKQLGDWLMTQPYPLVIERTPHRPALAESRRLTVLNQLAAAGYNVAPQRVVIGPGAFGQLSGVEAELSYQNLLEQTTREGALPFGVGGSGLGNVGSGSGGQDSGGNAGPSGLGTR